MGQTAPQAEIAKVILDRRAQGTVEAAGVDRVKRLYAFAPLGQNAYVYVGIPSALAYADATRVLYTNLIALGLVGLLALAAAWFGGDLLALRPLQRLTETAHRLAQGDLGARTGIEHGLRELGQLAQAFDTMATEQEKQTQERERAAETLRESEAKYRDLTESLDEVIYRADPETLVATYVNSAIERIYGYTVEEWLRDPALWENTIHPEDKERVLAEMTQARRKMESSTVVYRIIRKDKTVRWVEDHVGWKNDQQGNVVSMSGVMYDSTERKRAEMAVERNLAHLSALHRIDQAIAGSLDLRLTLSVLLEETTKRLAVDAATVLLLNLTCSRFMYHL